MDENIRVIEINGVKLEVDLRNAKKVESYKVGDRVKVLKKEYSDTYKVRYGVIVDFGLFKNRPTIEILSVSSDGGQFDTTLEFNCLNQDTKDIEIAPLSYLDETFAKDSIVERLDDEIEKKAVELMNLKKKKELFLRHFGNYYPTVEEE